MKSHVYTGNIVQCYEVSISSLNERRVGATARARSSMTRVFARLRDAPHRRCSGASASCACAPAQSTATSPLAPTSRDKRTKALNYVHPIRRSVIIVLSYMQ